MKILYGTIKTLHGVIKILQVTNKILHGIINIINDIKKKFLLQSRGVFYYRNLIRCYGNHVTY